MMVMSALPREEEYALQDLRRDMYCLSDDFQKMSSSGATVDLGVCLLVGGS